MGRPKNVIPSIEKHISIPQDVVARVELELWSEVEGRVPQSAWKELVTELLEQWLEARKR